jgi:hypothetical protein
MDATGVPGKCRGVGSTRTARKKTLKPVALRSLVEPTNVKRTKDKSHFPFCLTLQIDREERMEIEKKRITKQKGCKREFFRLVNRK